MFPKVPFKRKITSLSAVTKHEPSRLTIACGFSRNGAEVLLQWNPPKTFRVSALSHNDQFADATWRRTTDPSMNLGHMEIFTDIPAS